MSDINAILDRHGIKRCGDSSCIFGPRGGMMTNGGCRCGHDDPGAPSRPTRLSRQLAHAVTEQAAEIARLTAELAAARAVPADVEAAIIAYRDAAQSFGMSALIDGGAALRTAITTAIAAAREAGRREVLDEIRTALGHAVIGDEPATATIARILDKRHRYGEALAARNVASDGLRPVLSREDADALIDAHASALDRMSGFADEPPLPISDGVLAVSTARAALLAALTGAGGGS